MPDSIRLRRRSTLPSPVLQLPYIAELARNVYLHSSGQQRGVLLCAMQQRMGAQIQASLRARQGKRPRLEDAEEAGINQGGGGGVSQFYPGKQGPGNDTVFQPPRPEAPTMASRRFSYLGIDPAQQQQYEDLMSRARRLDRRDARRRQLTTSAEELPGTFKVGCPMPDGALPRCLRHGSAH